MAAEEDAHTKGQRRGGAHKWKHAIKRRYNRDLQRQKQRRKRHRDVNRQIWAWLQALVAQAKATATTLMQPTKNEEDETRVHPPGEALIEKAMAAQHWVAIGADEEKISSASAGRKIKDGMLFRVAVSIAGRRVIVLIDSGASQSYMAPETAALCELECESAELYLELADGSKITSTQQTQFTNCTVGEAVSQIKFTITKLLSNVDVVLGMDWLARWNPVIDWKRQVIHIYVNRQWTQVHGVLLDDTQQVGTVKVLEPYRLCEEKNMPDWVVVKTPKVWCPMIHKPAKQTCTITATSTNDVSKNSFNSNPVPTAKASRHKSAGTVQQGNTNDCETTRQFISSKRLQKLLKRGEQVYLAMVRPTGIQKQGITQKVKQQIMKEKGPIRKAPPIAETRRKMCNEAPVAIRKQLQGLLEQYADLFPEQLPKGRPPKRAVEFEINTEEGAVPPNKPPYRLSPKEHDELQAQIDDLLAQGHIRPSTSPYGAPVLFVPKKDGRWRMCGLPCPQSTDNPR